MLGVHYKIGGHQGYKLPAGIIGGFTGCLPFFAGPKKSSDEDGPESFHIVLIDNGRSEMLANQYRDMLRCIKCAACMNHCPVYQSVGGHAYSAVYPGPMGSVLSPLLRGEARDFQLPNATSVCGRCDEVCPVEIPLTKLMRELRNEHQAQSIIARVVIRAFTQLASHPQLYRLLTNIGIKMLGLLALGKRSIRSIPFAGAWTRHKDLPKPAASSFQQQWSRALKQSHQMSVQAEVRKP